MDYDIETDGQHQNTIATFFIDLSQFIHFGSMNSISTKLLRNRALEYVKQEILPSMTLI